MKHGSSNFKRNKITLKDIAEKTGFTINTVSRALKDKEDISKKTIKVIKATAKKLGYIPNSIAGSLRSGKTKTIAIILGDISNPIFAILVKELEVLLRKNYYNAFIINTEEKYEIEKEAILTSLSKKVDGIILFPSQMSNADVLFLKNSGTPFILIGRYFEDFDTDYVIPDDVKGGYLATQHLISCGHNRILFLNGPRYVSCAEGRFEGYIKALKKSNVSIVNELIKEVSITSGESQKVVKGAIRSKLPFTAIFAFSDLIAWEAIYALQNLGLNVPSDIAVIGYDNIQSKLYIPFPLTTIHYSKSEMAKRAVDILLERISSPHKSDRYYHHIIDTELIIRKTV